MGPGGRSSALFYALGPQRRAIQGGLQVALLDERLVRKFLVSLHMQKTVVVAFRLLLHASPHNIPKHAHRSSLHTGSPSTSTSGSHSMRPLPLVAVKAR